MCACVCLYVWLVVWMFKMSANEWACAVFKYNAYLSILCMHRACMYVLYVCLSMCLWVCLCVYLRCLCVCVRTLASRVGVVGGAPPLGVIGLKMAPLAPASRHSATGGSTAENQNHMARLPACPSACSPHTPTQASTHPLSSTPPTPHSSRGGGGGEWKEDGKRAYRNSSGTRNERKSKKRKRKKIQNSLLPMSPCLVKSNVSWFHMVSVFLLTVKLTEIPVSVWGEACHWSRA